jgi:hypothetical protein
LTTDGAAFTARTCARLLVGIRASHRRVTALSALAEGADTLFAGAAAMLGVSLEVVRPHDDYRADFRSRTTRALYDQLVATARHRRVMPYSQRCDAAYQAAMTWVADECDVLVAIWDGRLSPNVGGTAETVRYARAGDRAIVHVDPLAQRVFLD